MAKQSQSHSSTTSSHPEADVEYLYAGNGKFNMPPEVLLEFVLDDVRRGASKAKRRDIWSQDRVLWRIGMDRGEVLALF